MIPIMIDTEGIIDSDMNEKSSEIKKAKNVTIMGQVFLFFFFMIFLSIIIIKRPFGPLLHKMAISIVNFMS